MTFIGKILVVVILAFSLLFVGFAIQVYSVQTNWMKIVKGDEVKDIEGLEDKLARVGREKKDLQAERDKLEDDLQQTIRIQGDDIERLQADEADRDRELERLEAQERDLQQQVQRNQEHASTALREGEARRAEAVRLREQLENVRLEKDEAVNKQIATRDQLFEVTHQLDLVETRYNELLARVAKLETMLRNLGQDPGQPLDETEVLANPPMVDGVVRNTNEGSRGVGREALVEISIGSDDGLIAGHILLAWRPGTNPTYLGKIQVIETDPDRAVARVLGKTKIQEHDRVTTRF